MARLLLIVCAIFCALGPVWAQSVPDQTPPPARLIKPRPSRTDSHSVEHPHAHLGPLDERCRPLKDQLEGALQKSGDPHRLFQARLAHNAGARLCREGHADKGMAEFQKGLSYLQP